MGEKFKEEVCDLLIEAITREDPIIDDPRTSWDTEGCESFTSKSRPIGTDGLEFSLKVCGNCVHYAIAEYQYIYGSPSEGGEVVRVGQPHNF